MKEGVFRILGLIFLVIGISLIIAGIIVMFNSFSAVTGYAVSEEMNETATNFLGIWFLLIGAILVASWASYLLRKEK
ncbi:MAG: hypothetical protein ABIE22_00310 [archaeon]